MDGVIFFPDIKLLEEVIYLSLVITIFFSLQSSVQPVGL